MMRQLMLWTLTVSPLFSGCLLSKKFQEPQKLGGEWVSARTLNLGHDTYMQYCYQCHGVNGDGKGPAAPGMYPAPRNFITGQFKFQSVAAGMLPTDADLKHTIKNGLRGTQMLPWDISEERLVAVVHYIKTFSPVWKEQTAGEPLVYSEDPWGPKLVSEAVAQGKKIYHGLAQCYSCHPSYASLEEVSAWSVELTGNAVPEMRANPHISINQDTSYGKVMPPDLTMTPIKNGGDVRSTYRTLALGVNGTTMPAWKGLLSPKGDDVESEKNLWALSYYVNYLHEMRFDWKARSAFLGDLNERRKNDAQPAAPKVE